MGRLLNRPMLHREAVSLRTASERIQEKWPTLSLVGTYSPPFAPLENMDHDDICRRIRAARPDILLVAFGCPKQEKWLNTHLAATGVPVGIGVGATIDFLAGTVKQAPPWMRACSLEWIWRIAQEPRRLFSRYLKDALTAGPGLLRQLWRMQGKRFLPNGRAPRFDKVTDFPNPKDPNHDFVMLPLRFDARTLASQPFAKAFEDSDTPSLLVDASRNTFVDATGLGKLLRLSRTARKRGGGVILVQPTVELVDTLTSMKLLPLFDCAPSAGEALQKANPALHDTTPPLNRKTKLRA